MKNKTLQCLVMLFLFPFFVKRSGNEANAQNIITIAGNGGIGYAGDGGPATAAEFFYPRGMAMDKGGNIYVADGSNNRIRIVSPGGTINTFAGNGVAGYSGDGGPATAAEMNYPYGMAADGAGNVYFADVNNAAIRKVNAGTITTFAGNGTAGYSGDGGQATAAELNLPHSIAIDVSGNIYIADYGNNRIREVNSAGVITTFAGNGTAGFSGDGGPAAAAEINAPTGVAVDSLGNVYIADYGNNLVRKVNSAGIISTIAGNGIAGYSGDGGPATAAEINGPIAFAVDSAGDVYITDVSNNRVRMVNPGGKITTIAGNGVAGFAGDGGPATAAELYWPEGIARNIKGDVYIVEVLNCRVREIPSPLSGAIDSIKNLSCNGDNSGSATAKPIGGRAKYTYSWSNGQTTAKATGLSAGTYTVTITDTAANSTTATVTITQPAVLTAITGSIVNISCNGDKDGSAAAIAIGGTGAYTYSWSDANTQKSYTATGLTAGSYTVTITDSHGCSTKASASVTQPAPLEADTSKVNISCNGDNNGSATINASGGTWGYTYSWSNGSSNSTISGLSAGTYSVMLTDSHGCSTTAGATITQPPALIITGIMATPNTICAGSCTSIDLTVKGGTPAYNYTWSNGATVSSPNVCPELTTTYSVTIMDVNGCSYDSAITITVNPLPSVTFKATKDSVCVNWTKDSLIGTPSGGTFSGTGVTGKNFNASVAGVGAHSIMYTYTNNSGCSNTDTIELLVNACTGIDEINSLDGEVTFYPNPFSGNINVDISYNGPVTINMFNMMGQNVGTWQMEQGKHIISTQSLPAGVYMMQVKTTTGMLNKKLIKVN